MTNLRDVISQYVELTDEEWKLWEDIITVKYYKKGEQISFKDDIWTDFIFLKSGLIRSYIINNEGKEYTRQFYFNTDESQLQHFFAIDYTSLLQQSPSCRGFEVLEDSEVLIYDIKRFYLLCDKYKIFEKIGRLVAEAAYFVMDRNYTRLFTQSTIERYEYILTHMPNFVKRVPQYHIASYLGITPISLSRIKTQLEKEKKQSLF